MALFVFLGQCLRLEPATQFGEIYRLENNEAQARFDREGAFPVAIIYISDYRITDFVADRMMVGLVVGYRPSSFGHVVALHVQVREGMDPVTVYNRAPITYGFYYVCEIPSALIYLRPEQIAAMVQRARDMPRDDSPPVGLPAPLENIPGAPLYFSPPLYESGSSDSDGDSGDSDDDRDSNDSDEDSGDDWDGNDGQSRWDRADGSADSGENDFDPESISEVRRSNTVRIIDPRIGAVLITTRLDDVVAALYHTIRSNTGVFDGELRALGMALDAAAEAAAAGPAAGAAGAAASEDV